MKILQTAALSLIIAACLVTAVGQVSCPTSENYPGLTCTTRNITLVDPDRVTIKIYKKNRRGIPGFDRTFVVVHANEEKGLDAAKSVIAASYGRLVEVVSKRPGGWGNTRNLHFGEGGKHCVDPNRIYSEIGIRATLNDRGTGCTLVPSPTQVQLQQIKAFADKFLRIVTEDFREKFIIGVHNNDPGGLSLDSWSYAKDCSGNRGAEAKTAGGVFRANVLDSEDALDVDDFVLVTNQVLFQKIMSLGEPMNIALQSSRTALSRNLGNLDDGSMSIFFGIRRGYSYVNVEAEGKPNTDDVHKTRQMRMIELVNTRIRF